MKGSPRYFDLSLGDKHYLAWVRNRDGDIVGGIIRHPKADNPLGYCEGAFSLDLPENRSDHAVWKMAGSFEKPTLEPSILCHCKKDHGWIRGGEWIPEK